MENYAIKFENVSKIYKLKKTLIIHLVNRLKSIK